MKKITKNSCQRQFNGIKGRKPHFPHIITKQGLREINRYNLPINSESLHKCLNFIHKCHRQSQENLNSSGSFYLEELMMTISGLYSDLIQEGNFRLAGTLPAIRKRLKILEQLNMAYLRYGAMVRICS